MGKHAVERYKFADRPDLFEVICQRVENGESLSAICAAAPMPSYAAVFHWMKLRKDWADRYAHAREIAEEKLCDETRLIAKGEPGFTTGDTQRDKLLVDRDKWFLAVSNPKKYSERKQLDMNVTVNLEQLIMQAYAPAIEAPVIDNEEDGQLW